MLVKNLTQIYGSSSKDIRLTYWYQTSWGTSYLKKHDANLIFSKEKIRMITLPEMYYIAAEAHPQEASSLLEELLPSREIHTILSESSTRDDVLIEILKEYRKEYLGDGQFFYACKRLIDERNVLSTVGVNIPDEEKVLVWPLPDDEIKYGDRDSEIWE